MATLTEERIEPYETVPCIPHAKPVLVNHRPTYDRHVFIERPLLGALLFDNVDSDARDHCANERSRSMSLARMMITKSFLIHDCSLAFLSWLRLAIYMAVVSVAILISWIYSVDVNPSSILLSVAKSNVCKQKYGNVASTFSIPRLMIVICFDIALF
ncbi:hypothetical protein D6C83_03707 [Aureobasidium pullulans]|uniref:DUF202 domain-containing protein n=1 Tax=Aureobasidium pullulans TaxID=5580 RepID=A0A4T0DH73_AURPU|nr:hypothetical protein D6C83_03707 [Aureobasidium pullulans]